jgi:hypothetical protein
MILALFSCHKLHGCHVSITGINGRSLRNTDWGAIWWYDVYTKFYENTSVGWKADDKLRHNTIHCYFTYT